MSPFTYLARISFEHDGSYRGTFHRINQQGEAQTPWHSLCIQCNRHVDHRTRSYEPTLLGRPSSSDRAFFRRIVDLVQGIRLDPPRGRTRAELEHICATSSWKNAATCRATFVATGARTATRPRLSSQHARTPLAAWGASQLDEVPRPRKAQSGAVARLSI